MDILIGILIGLFVLMFLVTAHEFGHFIMARRNGVTVKEFGIGFPPRAIAWVKDPKTGKWTRIAKADWQKPQKSLVFSLNWLPIGGFCSMDGETDSDTKKGTFGAASFWQKTKILFGGVAMNWLVAMVLMSILAATGMPTFMDNQFSIESNRHQTLGEVVITDTLENSPARAAGFEPGDVIVSVNNIAIENSDTLVSYHDAHPGETLTYKIKRNGENQDITATLNAKDADYLLGVKMGQTVSQHYTWSSPIIGIVTTVQLTGETYRGLGNMFYSLGSGIVKQFSGDETTRNEGQAAIKTAGDSVSGPVGIIGYIFPQYAKAGLSNLAFLAALISISLACMNILPIPALDGGRWLLISIFRLRGKKLTKEIEEKIVARAFLVLIALIILVTIVDILRFF